MHYYKFNIGDYASHTRHLSPIEDIAYRRLLDLAYSTEIPLTSDIHQLSRLVNMREHQDAIKDVLAEFFNTTDEGWIHGRVLKEIEEAGDRSEKASSAALARWEKAKAMRKVCEGNADASINDAPSIENDATRDPLPETRDQLKSKAIVASDAGRLDCPAEKIVEAYHRMMPDNPFCKVLNAGRKGAIKSRWLEASKLECEPFGYKTEADGIAAWSEFFSVCAESPFLTGKAAPQPGKPPFFATIDFLFSPSGFAKCLENKYHARIA